MWPLRLLRFLLETNSSGGWIRIAKNSGFCFRKGSQRGSNPLLLRLLKNLDVRRCGQLQKCIFGPQQKCWEKGFGRDPLLRIRAWHNPKALLPKVRSNNPPTNGNHTSFERDQLLEPGAAEIAVNRGLGWRATLRRSSHRAVGRKLERSCLQLLRGVVVDGWFGALFGLSAEGVASNAPPIGEAELLRGGCYDGA